MLVLLLASVVAIVLSVAIGSVGIAPGRVVSVIAGHVLPCPVDAAATSVQDRIVWEFRLPRALLGFVVGASLAVAGAVLQAVVRNPLADPFVFGVSSGASVAAVAVLTLASGALASMSVPVAAFVGALATTLAVYGLAQRHQIRSPTGSVTRSTLRRFVGVSTAAIALLLVTSACSGAGGAEPVQQRR